MSNLGFATIPTIDDLLAESGSPLVSIYIPTAIAGQDTEQNRLRFKNQLKKVREQLGSNGCTGLGKNWDRLGAMEFDEELWQQTGRGMAWFISETVLTQVQLSHQPQERVEIGKRFFVRPLFAELSANQKFWLLTLSQNAIRLFQGNGHKLNALELPEAEPESIQETLGTQAGNDGTLQIHSFGNEKDTPVYHDQQDDEKKKDRILQHLAQVSEALSKTIELDSEPLVLAGIEFEITLYKNNAPANQNIIGELTGNFDQTSVSQLHAKGFAIVEQWIQETHKKMLEEAKGSRPEKVLKSACEITTAALQGRIDTVFYVPGADDIPGLIESSNQSVRRADGQQSELVAKTRDIIDLTLRQTMEHGGRIIAVSTEDLLQGESEPLLATLRD